MTLDLERFRGDLSESISATLGEFRGSAEDVMEMFAVDCHPWNGVITLAFLTRPEVEESPFLADAAEMAAWKYYDFSAALDSWSPTDDLASSMQAAYEGAGGNRDSVAAQYFEACAEAVATDSVQGMLKGFNLASGFRITIPHPDTGEEYYPPT